MAIRPLKFSARLKKGGLIEVHLIGYSEDGQLVHVHSQDYSRSDPEPVLQGMLAAADSSYPSKPAKAPKAASKAE